MFLNYSFHISKDRQLFDSELQKALRPFCLVLSIVGKAGFSSQHGAFPLLLSGEAGACIEMCRVLSFVILCSNSFLNCFLVFLVFSLFKYFRVSTGTTLALYAVKLWVFIGLY